MQKGQEEGLGQASGLIRKYYIEIKPAEKQISFGWFLLGNCAKIQYVVEFILTE